MKVSVCADMLFGDMPTAKAMELLKAAGADAVEFWGVDGKDLRAIAAASRSLGLPVAVFCGPPVSLIAPGQAAAFAEGLKALVPVGDFVDKPTPVEDAPQAYLTLRDHPEALSAIGFKW